MSVRQSNKILRLIVASSWVFYLSKPHALRTYQKPDINVLIQHFGQLATEVDTIVNYNTTLHGCTNPGRKIAKATNFIFIYDDA